MEASGRLFKLTSKLGQPVEYRLPIGDQEIPLNPWIGKKISLKFSGEITCIYCQRKIKKSYSQGYCFPCSQTLARCDFCIVQPEKCHYHLGTCREPEWGKANCFIPHIIYIANTSGLKVGITRETQVPTRWIDQGAIQALPFARVKSRYHAGLVEVAIKQELNDKTNWRKMLINTEKMDLLAERETLQKFFPFPVEMEWMQDASVVDIHYPIDKALDKIKSFNFDKTPEISGTLLGIKGQYLFFEQGVLNIRKATGYHITFQG